MAMIYCKNCGKPVSSEAKFCPNCSAKLKSNKGLVVGLIITLVLLIVISVVLIIALCSGGGKENTEGGSGGNPGGNDVPEPIEDDELNEYGNNKFSLKYPRTCSFSAEEDGYYIFVKGDSIPYVYIYNYENISNIDTVYAYLKGEFTKYDGFESSSVDKVEFFGKTYDHIKFTYLISGKKVEDNRYSIIINNSVWTFTTKELVERNDDAHTALKAILKSFEVK